MPAYTQPCGRPGCSPGVCAGGCDQVRRYDPVAVDRAIADAAELDRAERAADGFATIRHPDRLVDVDVMLYPTVVAGSRVAHLARPDPEPDGCGWQPICPQQHVLELESVQDGSGRLTWCGACRSYATSIGVQLAESA